MNLYTYCHNNPVNYVDPSGHLSVCPQKYGRMRKLNLTDSDAKYFLTNIRNLKNSAQKGVFGEMVMDRIMKRNGYEKLPSKVGSNNGIDGIYVKRDAQGNISELVIGEAKFGRSRLGITKHIGTQMDNQ